MQDERMKQFRRMRAMGLSNKAIGDAVGLSRGRVQTISGKISHFNKYEAANDNAVVRAVPHNGGHSTAERPYAYISLPRVSIIDDQKVAA